MDQQQNDNITARLEQSFKEADQAREDLTESMSNSVAANSDLLHHGLVSSKGLETTTEMYRHLLGQLLRHRSGEVRAQVPYCSSTRHGAVLAPQTPARPRPADNGQRTCSSALSNVCRTRTLLAARLRKYVLYRGCRT